jgi:holo-[acyl-carrier protein] synthase
MVFGVGIDLVDVRRIEKTLDRYGDRFIAKVYSPSEIDYCSRKAMPQIHFAARFAVKESFMKALSIGLGMGVCLKDIEVINQVDNKPVLITHHKANDMITAAGITAIQLSITHTKHYANAIVILEK